MAEVYLTASIETARDKIVALAEALKTTMASGYDPTFSYVYERHAVARLLLNAVSVEVESARAEDLATGTFATQLHVLTLTVRVHTAYSGGIMDTNKIGRLLNSLLNKLQTNATLGDGYEMDAIPNIIVGTEFPESATLGGQVTVVVTKPINFTRE